MANALYDAGREAFLDGTISWSSDNIKVVLVDAADYTVNLATHTALSDIPAAGRVADNLEKKAWGNTLFPNAARV